MKENEVNEALKEEEQPADALSEYERARMETIARNREFLSRIANDSPAAVTTPTLNTALFRAAQEPERKRARRKVVEPPPPQRRYSLRSRPPPAAEQNTEGETEDNEGKKEEEEEKEEAGVRLYTCRAANTFRFGGQRNDDEKDDEDESERVPLSRFVVETPGGEDGDFVPCGFYDLGVVAEDAELQRTYALATDAGQRFLAAGGHQGRVAVFDLARWAVGSGACAAPLLSYRAHGGWVSGVHFVPRTAVPQGIGSSSSSSSIADSVLVTTGNDGGLVVWALDACAAPRAAAGTRLGTGIFSADCVADVAAVACKDGSVRTFALDAAGAVAPRTVLAGAHAGVAKCVRACPTAGAHVLASGGNDARVCVHDVRVPQGAAGAAAPVVEFAHVHTHAVNGVDWHPADAHVLASTSFDRSVCLLDVRQPAAPLQRYTGHAAAGASARHIHRAVFCCRGTALACSGDGSTRLSLYDARPTAPTGNTAISRGDVGSELSTLLSTTPATRLLVAAHGRTLSFFAPQFAHVHE